MLDVLAELDSRLKKLDFFMWVWRNEDDSIAERIEDVVQTSRRESSEAARKLEQQSLRIYPTASDEVNNSCRELLEVTVGLSAEFDLRNRTIWSFPSDVDLTTLGPGVDIAKLLVPRERSRAEFADDEMQGLKSLRARIESLRRLMLQEIDHID